MGKYYQKVFAAIYDPLLKGFEKGLSVNRYELLNPLRGKVLEVGSGTGVNFQFYHPDADVIAVEPSLPMLKKAEAKTVNFPNVSLYNYGVNDMEMHSIIANDSLDAISCTLVLCTIPNPELAIQNFKKWLKPGGKLVVLEHIKSKSRVGGVFQEVVNPLWKVVGEGCNLTRHTDVMIKEQGFVAEQTNYFDNTLRWIQGIYTLKT